MQQLVAFSTDRSLETSAEFKIGVRSVPYLADHGFHDMVVLPGSFYIGMALCVEHAASRRVPNLIRNVTFHNPVILSSEDTAIEVDVTHGDGRAEYTFSENSVTHGSSGNSPGDYAAKFEVDCNLLVSPRTCVNTFSIREFQVQSDSVIDSERFYTSLRENGNHYGPRFQNVSSIWRAGNQSLGNLSAAREEMDLFRRYAILLDSAIQLLAPFVTERGKTLILRSIENIEVTDFDVPDKVWGHAMLLPGHEDESKVLAGNVRVFDESGKPYLELSGVRFTLVDRVDSTDEKTATRIAIASNFTAEPVEDSLKFWGDYFGAPVHLEFAPYNQVFQQLLDAESAFRKNSDGVNIILLGLEEWVAPGRHAMNLAKQNADQCFKNYPRYVLPNGMEIVHLNQYETDYLYREIFEDRCYLRHGIHLQDGDTVVDIGANIGLFSLFVTSRCRNARIYAFEPAPPVYELLKANCAAYGANVLAMNTGVSDQLKNATLTFYEKSSVFSGFNADETADRNAIETVIRNTLEKEKVAEGDAVEEYVHDLTAGRLRYSTYECRMTSVSDIIRENQIENINLLKIDAEKSELAIIRGIEDQDWPKISQIVVEIHDPTREALRQIEDLLLGKGFRCAVEQESLLDRSGLFNLYAIRSEARGETRLNSNLQPPVQEFCAALRSFMNEATAPVVLCVSPTTPAADADLKTALNEAEQTLISEAGAIPNVHIITSASQSQRYPVNDYYDPHSHRLAHIPYTPECYAAMGTAMFRTISSLRRKPFKVIALDCDNTLWKGVCGEDGPSGVEVSAPYRRLQEFMIGQMKAGMLLCLCSKNNEKDVLDVFDQRTDMVLKREHLASWRINWNSKSDNLASLENELKVGLDSFIFIDDSPVDCADVQINCPGVLSLRLPPDGESFAPFLNHVWGFDHANLTQEDRNRTRMYQESTRRQKFLEQTPSLKDFIKGLQLHVEITEATDEQLSRVSQLTFRTNQFNFTTVRRSGNEIRDLLRKENAKCLVVHAADRFGDYGLVGVVIYKPETDRYNVDTLLLSCRVLGRGVEHKLLSHLCRRAVSEGKTFVELTYRQTERNLPAMEFITGIGDQYRNGATMAWILPAERLANLEYNPDEKGHSGRGTQAATAADDANKLTTRPASGFRSVAWTERTQEIADSLYDMDRIARSMEEYRLRNEPLPAPADVATGSTLETALLKIWRRVLGRPRIGMNDNFFEVGGTSLKAVQVIATIKKDLKQNLSIVTLFECPTVRLLAGKLTAGSGASRGETKPAGAVLRGRQRRISTVRPNAS